MREILRLQWILDWQLVGIWFRVSSDLRNTAGNSDYSLRQSERGARHGSWSWQMPLGQKSLIQNRCIVLYISIFYIII